jgi:hypothetical protein
MQHGPWSFSLVASLGLFTGTVILILVGFEIGLQLGRWRAARPNPEPQVPARTIVASILSLLAFVLGFTFGIAATHFDARNDAMDDEVMAIASAYHRADLLNDPPRSQLQQLLREYVVRRVEVGQSNLPYVVIAQIRELQQRIWDVLTEMRDSSGQQTSPAVAQSFSDLIDVKSERVLKHMEARIPFGMWFFLCAITFVATIAAGYQSGLGGARRSISAVAYAVAFAAVVLMIADADIPQFGELKQNRQALIELENRLKDGLLDSPAAKSGRNSR